MSLKDLIEWDVVDVFVNTDDFAEECTYQQGAETPIEIDGAIRSNVEYEVIDDEGFATKYTVTDWLIPAVYLVGTTPRSGDRIEVTRGSETQTFEICPPSSDMQATRLDVSGHLWTLHTKQVK